MPESSSRRALATAHLIVCAVIVALILIQAVLAGQAQFGTADILIHGYVGNLTFALGLVLALLAAAARLPGLLFGMSATLLALLFAQTGLGYVGREVLEAAAWHVPLGVAILGLATATLTAAAMRRAGSPAQRATAPQRS